MNLNLPPSSMPEPPSPCLRECHVVERVLPGSPEAVSMCAACGRTLDEIACWQRMSAQAKQACIRDAAMRLQLI